MPDQNFIVSFTIRPNFLMQLVFIQLNMLYLPIIVVVPVKCGTSAAKI